jgi:uncharacterized protein (DUF924 family)
MHRPQDILDYWFGDGSDTARRHRELWFAGSRRVDAEVAALFLGDVERAERGELEHWQADARSCLALVVVLDQFPLMIFRNEARGYRDGELALPVARHMHAKGFDQGLSPPEKLFAWLPFEHSEELADQDLAVELFATLRDAPGMASAYEFALKHREVIQRFGRFPHRNRALGRASTPEETAYLRQPGAGFGAK